jgi:HAD superfamily hydrolase (TIGR01509 family)
MFEPSTELEPPRRPQGVLFDVDGTLVDTNDLHADAWRRSFLEFGFGIPVEKIRTQIGKGGDNLIPTLLPDMDETLQEKMEVFRSGLFKREYLARAVPFPGVRALFERLTADGIRIVLASSSGADEVRYHLNLIACSDLVAATTTKDDVESSKPCPDIFEAALAKLAPLGPQDVVVVGDTPWDVKAAAKLGVPTIGFRSGGFEDAALREAGAFALFDGPADLLARYDSSPFAAPAHAEA